LAGRRHGSGDEFASRERFDPDGFGQFGADAKPYIADLTDYVGVLAKQFDPLLLAETQFAQPMGYFRRR
jgi:hypothetical protein